MLPQIDYLDRAAIIDGFERAADLLTSSPLRRGSTVHLPPRGQLTFSGDLHDYPGHLEAIVRLSRVQSVPENHLILHELIHGEWLYEGKDFSYRNLATVARLVCDHPMQVHPLLANHELAQCFRISVSKGGGDQVKLFDAGLAAAFGEHAEEVASAIREFILSMPLVVRAENGLWCGHSIPDRLDFDATAFDRALEPADYLPPAGAAWSVVWGRMHGAAHVARFLELVKAKLLVVGHCHAEEGIAGPAPGLIVVNSDHEKGVVVRFDLGLPLPPQREIEASAIPLELHRARM